jgi:hypothetical protein
VQLDAALGQLDGKSGRVMVLLGFRLNGLVWNEPDIAGASPVLRMAGGAQTLDSFRLLGLDPADPLRPVSLV